MARQPALLGGAAGVRRLPEGRRTGAGRRKGAARGTADAGSRPLPRPSARKRCRRWWNAPPHAPPRSARLSAPPSPSASAPRLTPSASTGRPPRVTRRGGCRTTSTLRDSARLPRSPRERRPARHPHRLRRWCWCVQARSPQLTEARAKAAAAQADAARRQDALTGAADAERRAKASVEHATSRHAEAERVLQSAKAELEAARSAHRARQTELRDARQAAAAADRAVEKANAAVEKIT